MKTTIKWKEVPRFLSVSAIIILGILFIETKIKSVKYEGILRDAMDTKALTQHSKNWYRQKFMSKARAARQVYQYRWWRYANSRYGKIPVLMKRAMNLKDFNYMMLESFRLNRALGLPIDSPQNFYMIAKWTLESAINDKAKHSTGELWWLAMAGYTDGGFQAALYHYKHDLKIDKGHPMYIDGIYDRHPNWENIFKGYINVIKFDYAYIHYLRSYHNYKWDFALTAFHFGEGKPIYWQRKGLHSVPMFRLDAKWKGYHIREYCETVHEIAYGIYLGKLTRISRWKERVGAIVKANKVRDAYVQNVRLQAIRNQSADEFEAELNEVNEKFKWYRKKNERAHQAQARLNNLILDERRGKRKR